MSAVLLLKEVLTDQIMQSTATIKCLTKTEEEDSTYNNQSNAVWLWSTIKWNIQGRTAMMEVWLLQ